jgi:hypothetical protein
MVQYLKILLIMKILTAFVDKKGQLGEVFRVYVENVCRMLLPELILTAERIKNKYKMKLILCGIYFRKGIIV